jgi:small subunit ribosomal protein S4
VNYIRQAKKIKGATGNILLQLLEMRLDNIIFQVGMAPTIAAARQIVGHRHITINKSCVSIPSYQCKHGDTISVKDSTASKQLILRNLELRRFRFVPPHLDFEEKILSVKVCGVADCFDYVERIDRFSFDVNTKRRSSPDWFRLKVNELFVVEFYSRKI